MRRTLPWLVLVVVLVVYGAAFWQPARSWIHRDGNVGRVQLGYEAFSEALAWSHYVWLGNVFLWIGAVLLVLRMWRWATLSGLIAFLIAFNFYSYHLEDATDAGRYQAGLGFWLWTGSMALLTVLGVLGTLALPAAEQTGLPRLTEYWRSGRGVLDAGLAILLAIGAVTLSLTLKGAHRSNPKPSEPRWDTSDSICTVPLYLVPLEQPEKPPEKPDVVWQSLFRDMAADPQSQALFRRLLGKGVGDLQAPPAYTPEQERSWDARTKPTPPPADRPTALLELRPARTEPKPGAGEFAGCLNVGVCPSFYYFHGTRQNLYSRHQSLSIDLTLLLANEYLTRQQKGYLLRHGQVPEHRGAIGLRAEPKIAGTPDEIRKGVESDLQSFRNHVEQTLNRRDSY